MTDIDKTIDTTRARADETAPPPTVPFSKYVPTIIIVAVFYGILALMLIATFVALALNSGSTPPPTP